jgi:SsrA-binding protein
MAPRAQPPRKLIAENRQARYDFAIEEVYEAGIVLKGTEVKALRLGRANIAESYASPEGGGVTLINSYIPEYPPAARFNHEPRRHRRLLLKTRDVAKLFGAVKREGRTLVPLKLYFNDRGLAKLEIGLAKGRKTVDKREYEKEKDWKRQQARLMREKG